MLEWAVYISVGWSLILFIYLVIFRSGSGRRGKLDIFVLFFACVFWPLTLVILGLVLAGVIRRRAPEAERRRIDARSFY